jgi:hypothetical protein
MPSRAGFAVQRHHGVLQGLNEVLPSARYNVISMIYMLSNTEMPVACPLLYNLRGEVCHFNDFADVQPVCDVK